jgi:hypothetical protein
MEKKKFFTCLIGIFVPIYIFCSSLTALKHEKDYRLSVLTRDAAQLMYLCVSIMNVLGFSTNIQFYNGWITLDLIFITVLGFSCAFMSWSLFKESPDIFFAVWDVTANGAACACLVVTLTPYLYHYSIH